VGIVSFLDTGLKTTNLPIPKGVLNVARIDAAIPLAWFQLRFLPVFALVGSADASASIIACTTTDAASRLASLKHKMEGREARVGIVGMGYAGLPLALLFRAERIAAFAFAAFPLLLALRFTGRFLAGF
jgi:hypothetical protein